MKDCKFCNDETQEKTLTCFRCEAQWQILTEFHDRVARCPQHYRSRAVCGGSAELCKECRDQGFYLERNFNCRSFGGNFVIKQTTPDETDDSDKTKLFDTTDTTIKTDATDTTNATDKTNKIKIISVHQFQRIDYAYDSNEDDDNDHGDCNCYSGDSDDDCKYSSKRNKSKSESKNNRQKRLKTTQ